MEQNDTTGFFEKPLIGNALAVAAGLSFFFLCMILPLVGPAGSKVEHAGQNKLAFTGVLLLTFLLAGAAAFSKMRRRAADGSPLPLWSLGLCVLCLLTFVVLMVGGFAI
ncbi:MAG: hypothetical protein K9M45_05420 [Kiritimatiellales bacterium]|nr:hypothetical protein [Kiritimatiellales bacterium]